jgi:ankyrin repeat protein
LLNRGADPNQKLADDETALSLAVDADEQDITEILLLFRADPEVMTQRGPILMLAVQKGNPQLVDLLLSKGASPNSADESGRTPLMSAVADGQTDIVRALLARGADVNARTAEDSTALSLAVMAQQVELATELLLRGADPNVATETGTVLTEAITQGNTALVETLIGRGVDVSAADSEGRTPLALAIAKGDRRVEELLRRAGAEE